jgi:hypothetical protein
MGSSHPVMTPASHPRTLTIALLATMILLGGCQRSHPRHLTGRFQANGVTVTVTLQASDRPSAHVTATFRPDQPGFHLYSIDLPPEGVDGLGIATKFSAVRGLQATGPPSANRPLRTLRPTGLDVDLPVYPDGPVTVSLPVTPDPRESPVVAVSYAACSQQRCMMPVIDQAIALRSS